MKIINKSKNNKFLHIPESILAKLEKEFTKDFHTEDVAFLYGIESLTIDMISAIGVPKVDKSWGHYFVEMEDMTELSRKMSSQGLVCLAQIHSHPPSVPFHSEYDDEMAISLRNGFISIIVPNYGKIQYNDLDDMTVHEIWDRNWFVLSPLAVNNRIKIIKNEIYGGQK